MEVVEVFRKDHGHKAPVVGEGVHVHIRRPIVLLVEGGSFFHNPVHSHHNVLFLVNVRGGSLSENSLVQDVLDDRKDLPFLVVHSDVGEYEIDNPHLLVDVLPESACRAM